MLPYSGLPDRRPPLLTFYRTDAWRVLIGCWAIPFSIGIAVFVAYLLLHKFRRAADCLVIAGMFVLIVGLLATVVGVCTILMAVATRWPLSRSRWTEVAWPAAVALSLLASNFAVAIILAMFADPDGPY